MIKEYWNLIGWQPFLAITWELDFPQACSFRWMLMKHKNFHFTQIQDKTNDMIFLKSPKTMFLGQFWPIFGHFCLIKIFSKKSGSVTHNYIEKTDEPIPRKLTDRQKDRRTEGRTDGQTLFYRTLSAVAGGATKCS